MHGRRLGARLPHVLSQQPACPKTLRVFSSILPQTSTTAQPHANAHILSTHSRTTTTSASALRTLTSLNQPNARIPLHKRQLHEFYQQALQFKPHSTSSTPQLTLSSPSTRSFSSKAGLSSYYRSHAPQSALSPFSPRIPLFQQHSLSQHKQLTAPILHQSRRFAKLDFSRYYFFARSRKMNYLLTNRGLIRPGRKHNYQYTMPHKYLRRVLRFARQMKWPRRLKQAFLIMWYWYLFIYLLPWFLRWQYDINPRTLTRFSRLDFEERWEHKIMTDLRLYRQFARYRTNPGSPEPGVAMNGLSTPMPKPFRQGMMYYYFMLVVYPFASGMMDPLLYPRLFFFGLEPHIPPDYQDPRLPENPLITMSTRQLLQFLSIVQTRMYLATQSRMYEDNEIQSKYIVYDTRNELDEYKLRAKRYRYNADLLNKTYEMIVHEVFRRIHSAVFYSGREAVIPAPKYIPSIPRYEINHDELLASTVRNDEDDPESLHLDQFQRQIPGLYEQLLKDLENSNSIDHQYNPSDRKNSIPYFYHRFKRVISSSFVAREAWAITRELANIVHVVFDRLTWTGAKTGLETIKGIDITVSGRDTAVFDYRLHDFQRPNYPLFFTTMQQQLRRIAQISYATVIQFSDSYRLDPNLLDKLQYPIWNLNSDVDELVHFLTQPELSEHYTRMLRSLAEIDHSITDGPNYDYRRVNLGVLNDRKFKLKQNIIIVQTIIDTVQHDLNVAKAVAVRDGDRLSPKQLGCEWVLYELKLQHLQMRRILRDMEYFIQSDSSHMIDENIEPCRGDTNLIALSLDLVPFQLGNIPKNLLRRMGWIEIGSIPLHGE